MDLASALAGWHDFFLAAAGAGAALLGLVFVGLSIHLDRTTDPATLMPLAIAGAVTLFYPVVISVLMLMPIAQPWLPSGILLVVAAFAILSSAQPIVNARLRHLWYARPRLADAVRYGVPLLATVSLIGVSGLLLVDPVPALYAMAMIIVIYIVVGTQNAWNVLLAGRAEVGVWTRPTGGE